MLDALIVMFLLWLFARHEAELSYARIFLVISALSILVFLIGLQHPLIAFIGYVVVLPIVITRFFYVSLPKASIITVLFLVWQLLFQIAFSYITRPSRLLIQHVDTHTEHTTGAHPQSAGTGTPAGNATAKLAASAPSASVYHYNFRTKSGLIGRDFRRPLTPQEQSAIARQIANGQQ